VVSGVEPVRIVVTDCDDDDVDNHRMDVNVAKAFNQVAVFKLLLRIAARVNKAWRVLSTLQAYCVQQY
jgi:hypothetical protein